jgi:hypothetical protein
MSQYLESTIKVGGGNLAGSRQSALPKDHLGSHPDMTPLRPCACRRVRGLISESAQNRSAPAAGWRLRNYPDTEFVVSHLSDNVITLNYYQDQGQVKRALSVIKTRASGHDPAMHEFTISPTGITINDKLTINDQSA